MEVVDFINQVKEELIGVRALATQQEVDRLDYNTLDYTTTDLCIYGQMTGDSRSARSIYLAPKVYTYECWDGASIYEAIHLFSNHDFSTYKQNFTALEKYLFMCSNKGKKEIVEYIKGERDNIDLLSDFKSTAFTLSERFVMFLEDNMLRVANSLTSKAPL